MARDGPPSVERVLKVQELMLHTLAFLALTVCVPCHMFTKTVEAAARRTYLWAQGQCSRSLCPDLVLAHP